ncbi:hypothetical protein [Methylobacterium bullatum]|uniref:Uncharacterized protein n=1 Tax=Methylobacterium bullatum TaxID=570505 RepID=A0AAV4ZCM7_9HYPH|nr:hypothetical protein [Methylobacterium bullatum]MBD8902756.1 hypothetical protein [Methylobacterium bullatum]GJD41338.1 hypothetical protein OICFNHDK_3821 [Methylobacterium bullatum]
MKQVTLTPFEKLTRSQLISIADLWWKRLDTVEIGDRLKISEADVCRVIARQQRNRRNTLLSSRRA